MKKIIIVFIAFLAFSCAKENTPFTVLTFNIRYNNPNDGDNAWPNRKEMAADLIRFHQADIVGVQEALSGQLADLRNLLPGYGWYGLGRDDGKQAGEFMAVFYRKGRFTLTDSATFWLSETPDKPSKGWDAACFRTVTLCRFTDIKTGKQFAFFNTHFDHKGEEARRQSAHLLLKLVTQQATNIPAVVTGDFNAIPSDEPIRILTAENSPLKDTFSLAPDGHCGPAGTWNGFTEIQQEQRIDYIFIKGDATILRHGTLTDTNHGRFPSDHLPVLAEVMIE